MAYTDFVNSELEDKINEFNTKLLAHGCTFKIKLYSMKDLENSIETGTKQITNITFYSTDNDNNMLPDSNAYKILLCLMDNDKCISSLTLYFIENIIEILSATHTDYRKYQYNKLLRAIIIIIGNMILQAPLHKDNKFNTIRSKATNAISAYVMIHYFNASCKVCYHDGKPSEYPVPPLTKDNVTLASITKYIPDSAHADYDDFSHLLLDVALNDENIENAKTVFNNILNGNNGNNGNNGKISNNKKKFLNVNVNIQVKMEVV